MGSGTTHYSEAQAVNKAQDLFKELKDSMGKKAESAKAVINAAVFLNVMELDQPDIPKGTKAIEEAKIYFNYYKELLKQQGVNVNENSCANASGSRGCVVSGGRRRSTRRRRNLRKRSTRRN